MRRFALLWIIYCAIGQEFEQDNDVLILKTYAGITPNKSSYTLNDFIFECGTYNLVANQAGYVNERTAERNIMFKIRVFLIGRNGKTLAYESPFGHRALLPTKIRNFSTMDYEVYAFCKDSNWNFYYVYIPIEGMVGAKSTVPDLSIVYIGQEIECVGESISSGTTLWLYYNGFVQSSSGNILKITYNEPMVQRTPHTSYACSSLGAGGFRKVYTFYIASFFYQAIQPFKKYFNPGDLLTCHMYAATMFDHVGTSEILSKVGMRLTVTLRNKKTFIQERINSATMYLPDSPDGVISYTVQCLLEGIERTESETFQTQYAFNTYINPYRKSYRPGDKLECKNKEIYGSLKVRIILIELPSKRRPTPFPLNSILTKQYIDKMKNSDVVVINNAAPERFGSFYALCEVTKHKEISYTNPQMLNIRIDTPVRPMVLFPSGVKVERITFVTPGAMLKCEATYPTPAQWGHVQGDYSKCKLEVFGYFMRIPKVKENCIAEYACTGYSDESEMDIVDIRIIIEVMAKITTKIKGTQAFMSPGQTVKCEAIGHSEILNSEKRLDLEASLWFRPVHKAPQNLETGLIPKIIVPGTYHVDCRLTPGAFDEFKPLITSEANLVLIQYHPDKGKNLFPGDFVYCFVNIPVNGQLQLAHLRGLINIQVVHKRVAITLANRSSGFFIPEYLHLDYVRTKITDLKIIISCDVTGTLQNTWTADIITCEANIPFIEIEPEYSETVGVGTKFYCSTEKRCTNSFKYDLTISSSTVSEAEKGVTFRSRGKPIKITHEMLGARRILCAAIGLDGIILRKSRSVIIEGQPVGIILQRKAKSGHIINGPSGIVNANETLECSCSGYPNPHIDWIYISSPKTHSFYELIVEQHKIITTVFDPPGFYTYVCQASNKLGNIHVKHRFYLRNVHYIAMGHQTIIFYWILLAVLSFIALLFIGYFTMNVDFFRAKSLKGRS